MEQHKDGPAAAMLHRAQDTMAGMVGQAEAAAAARSTEGFIETAWASNLYEIRGAELALDCSSSPAVRRIPGSAKDIYVAKDARLKGTN